MQLKFNITESDSDLESLSSDYRLTSFQIRSPSTLETAKLKG